MESGNSGSFQSSTGDEEFDSLGVGDGISALNNLGAAPSIHNVTSFPNQQQVQPPPPQRNTILSNYMYDHDHHQPPPQQPLEHYQSSFLNPYVLDWSNNTHTHTQRSDPNSTDFNPMLASILASSSSHHHHGSTPQPPSLHHQTGAENSRVSLLESPQQPPLKKQRKRSRASRGAATTVLTTDTTNFRAMVQEFTGIPDPPFPSSHFQRTRLENIFGTGITTTTPPYLRRPFPQKINLPFSSSNTNNNINLGINYPFNLQNPESSSNTSNDQINTNMLIRPTTGFLDLISSDRRHRTTTNNNQAAGTWGNNIIGSNQEDDQSRVITTSATTNNNFSFSSS